MHGFNSDITGITDSLSPYLGREILKMQLSLVPEEVQGQSVMFLGNQDWNIIQVSRNKRPGILDYSELNSRILSDASLIINTTPLGMFPDTETRPEINYSLLNENHILFDLVYNPEITLFLRSGMKMGCSVITGLKMLHSQAERAWQIWNDDKF